MSKEVTNRKYKLVGFMNMFDIVPDFVFPVFQCFDDSLYYFHIGNEETLEITGFEPIPKRHTSRIVFLGDVVKSNHFSDTEVSLDSRPIFAFQVSDDFVQIGYYEDMRKFFETYETDNKILKEQINDFLFVTGSKI